MPTYTIFNQQIKAPTPDLACLKYAKQHEKELHISYDDIVRDYNLWIRDLATLPVWCDNIQAYIDAQYIQLTAQTFYPIRNFNILQESIEES